uniref:Uncharacterized protein n=1 Tax=Cuerna arida TaxID=1464854 RepID=A0A1B6G6X5_9HEMI
MNENEVSNFNSMRSEDSMRKGRRSSFFKRRSTFTADLSFMTDEILCEAEDKSSDQEVEHKLTQYIKELKREKEDWKKMYEKLKRDNRELKQKCSQLVDHSSSWDLLLPQDKRFLQERPDYVSVGRLVDRTAEAIAIRHNRTNATTDKLLHLTQDCQETISYVTATTILQIMSQFNELDVHCQDESN